MNLILRWKIFITGNIRNSDCFINLWKNYMILMRLSKALQVINLGYCLDHEVEIRSHIEEALRAFLLLHDTIMKTKLSGDTQ